MVGERWPTRQKQALERISKRRLGQMSVVQTDLFMNLFDLFDGSQQSEVVGGS